MKEYWIEVKGHPRYRVSTLGRVKCVDYRGTGKERILKPHIGGVGYYIIGIDGKTMNVHRLVLESFIPRPKNKPCIDHKDTNRLNNRLDNLRYCTHKENQNNTLTRKHLSENAAWRGKFGKENPTSKPIVQLTLSGSFVKKWDCARDVLRELGLNVHNICSCCIGKRNSTGGFRWVYATDYNPAKQSISEINPLF